MMNRRNALKSLMAMSAISMAPQYLKAKTSPEIQTHFIGLGNSGNNILKYFLKQDPTAKYTCLTTHKPQNPESDIKYIPIPYSGIKRKNAQLNIPEEVFDILEANDHYVLLTGLGGFSGSSLVWKLSIRLHSRNRSFLTICSLPYKFEGIKRRKEALNALNGISHLPQVKYLELDHLKQKYDDLMLSNCFMRGHMEFWEVYQKNI